MVNCCAPLNQALAHDNLFEGKRDFVLSALMITGIALLVIGACIQKGYIPFPGTATSYFLGFGGSFFGVGALGLCLRARGSQK